MALTGVISGVRSSATALSANQKPDIDSVLKLIEPYQSPFFNKYFLSGKKSKVVTNQNGKFNWFEDEYLPHQTTVTAAIPLSSTYYLNLTSSNCADVSFLKLNDLVYIEATDQLAFVSTVTSSTDVTLTRVHATIPTALTALSSADIGSYIKVVGSWNLENNATPSFLSTQEIEVYNYLTIFLEGVASTGRDQAGETYTDGTSHDEQVMKKMKEMKLQYERNFLYSNVATSVGTTTATKKTVGKGLKGFITSNLVQYSGAISEVVLDGFFAQVFNKGSMQRTFLVGNGLFNGIMDIIKTKQGSFQPVVDGSYGVRIVDYIHGMGDVKIVRDPQLDGKFSNAGFLYQEDQIVPRHMANDKKGSRKFRIEPNVETPGTDRTETKLLADIGIQFNNQELAGLLYQ